ncbi:chemotaxis protein [Clostridium sp. P21]|uniref:Chemotaxis protein n=1 Tax=Clostridium muellerianum TaxID=2716538 RepID=A0A7Y0EDP5_9CLOT|nr:chemotaxis protein [Clostridium muellerianum]NMM61478.1 chemotaxis protein [Clostridium muellerianum]
MYNVLVFGTGKVSDILETSLNNDVNIVAYVDNDKSKWKKLKNCKCIIQPNEIWKYKFDYILIASQFNEEIYYQLLNMGIDSDKIFEYYKFYINYYNYYKTNMDEFLNKYKKSVEIIATGISYANTGFRTDICCKNAYSFTWGSQDIFYDYYTVKFLLEKFPNKVSDLKHVLIGICYYSFQYDMSLSSMRSKVPLYYSVLKEAHNFKDIDKAYEAYELNKNIANVVLKKNNDGTYDLKSDIQTSIHYDDKWNIGKKQAELDCNKNYPETVKENTQIFKDYLQLLKDYNIKPIVVVFPASKYYTTYFSKRIEDEFHSIINGVRKEYDFQYIDYFRLDLFEDEDFADVSHLNDKGAEKLTKLLNEEIDWRDIS